MEKIKVRMDGDDWLSLAAPMSSAAQPRQETYLKSISHEVT